MESVLEQDKVGNLKGQEYIGKLEEITADLLEKQKTELYSFLNEVMNMSQAVLPATLLGDYEPEETSKKLQNYIKEKLGISLD